MITATEVTCDALRGAVGTLRESPKAADRLSCVLLEQALLVIKAQQAEIERPSKLVKP